MYAFSCVGIAGTVLRGAGRRVKKECDELVQAKGKIPVTQCLVSSAGNLPCKHLIHVHAPAPPKEPTDNADQYIEQYQHSLRNLFVTALQVSSLFLKSKINIQD